VEYAQRQRCGLEYRFRAYLDVVLDGGVHLEQECGEKTKRRNPAEVGFDRLKSSTRSVVLRFVRSFTMLAGRTLYTVRVRVYDGPDPGVHKKESG